MRDKRCTNTFNERVIFQVQCCNGHNEKSGHTICRFFFNAVWMLHKSRILCFILCIWNALEFQFIYPFVNWNPKTKLLLDSQFFFLWFCKLNPLHTAYTIKCKTKQMVACTLLWRARDHGYFTRLVWETYKRLDELISCAGFQRT